MGEIFMSIGQRIVELRKKCNISQNELAKLMEVSRQAVSKWENDQASPDTIKLIQLADILNTEVEYLATGRVIDRQPPPIVVNLIKKEEHEIENNVREPIVKQVVRYKTKIKYIRNPIEFIVIGLIGFIIGILIGIAL